SVCGAATALATVLALTTVGCGVAEGDEDGTDPSDPAASVSQPVSSGCHDATGYGTECVEASGSGLYINYVRGTFYNASPRQICSVHHLAVLRRDGSTLLNRYSARICVGPGDTTRHVFNEQRNF